MKRIILEIDDKYDDVISLTYMGLNNADNPWGCVLDVSSKCVDLREGNHIIIDADGSMKQDFLEGGGGYE